MNPTEFLDQLDGDEIEAAVREGRRPILAFRPEHDKQIAQAVEAAGVKPEYRNDAAQAVRASSYVTADGQITDALKSSLPEIVEHVVIDNLEHGVELAGPLSPARRAHTVRRVRTFGDFDHDPEHSPSRLKAAYVLHHGAEKFAALQLRWLRPENAPMRAEHQRAMAAKKTAAAQQEKQRLKARIEQMRQQIGAAR